MERWERVQRRRHGTTALLIGLLAVIVPGVDGEAQAEAVTTQHVVRASAMVPPQDGNAPAERFPRGAPQDYAFWKFGLGLTNLSLGLPVELVKNTAIEASKGDTFFAVSTGVDEGIGVGLTKGVARMGAGFLDIITFPFPLDPWYDPERLPRYPL